MLIAVAILLSGCAALASWHLARRQGRRPLRWAVWTFLLSGLPLVLLAIHGLFGGLPRLGSRAGKPCCARQDWTPVADLGHAGGCDLDLGRCRNCGSYLMAVFYVASTNLVVIPQDEAERFLALQGTPELKRALKAWVD